MKVIYKGEELGHFSNVYSKFLIDFQFISIKSIIDDFDVQLDDGSKGLLFLQNVERDTRSVSFGGNLYDLTTVYTFGIFGTNYLVILTVNGDFLNQYGETKYLFRNSLYECLSEASFSYKEKYIDCIVSKVESDFDLLELISQYLEQHQQYIFDRYGKDLVSGVVFPLGFSNAFKYLVFSLNVEKCFIDVNTRSTDGTKIFYMCSIRVLGASLDFLRYFDSLMRYNCVFITEKHEVPVVSDVSQFVVKSELESVRTELLGVIRAITTTPDPQQQDVVINNNAVLKMDDTQLVKLVDQLSVISQALIER